MQRGPNFYDELRKEHEKARNTPSNTIEAETTAHDKALEAKVEQGRIDGNEKVYQLRFDNEQLVKMNEAEARAKQSPEAGREVQRTPPPTAPSKFLSTGGGDLVSQQTVALENAKRANQSRTVPQQEAANGTERNQPTPTQPTQGEEKKTDWERYLNDPGYRNELHQQWSSAKQELTQRNDLNLER
jgi:hypothetical protein